MSMGIRVQGEELSSRTSDDPAQRQSVPRGNGSPTGWECRVLGQNPKPLNPNPLGSGAGSTAPIPQQGRSWV